MMVNVVKYCEYDEALYDYVRWCENNDCSLTFMVQTLLKKVFQVTTVANHIAEITAGPKPSVTDIPAVTSYFENFGSDLGKILRYATDFDATQLI